MAKKTEPSCTTCRQLLLSPTPPPVEAAAPSYQLILSKNRGGLTYPSQFLVQLTETAEKTFKVVTARSNSNRRQSEMLFKVTVRQSMRQPPAQFIQHATETQYRITNHYDTLLNKLLTLFYKLRMHELSRRCNIQLHTNLIRQKNNRLTIFTGQ